MWLLDILRKFVVVIVYLLVALFHFAEFIITLPFSQRESDLHLTCARIPLYSLYAFTRDEKDPYHDRFDFHHLSYGLALMLLPGGFKRFGKWMVFDSLTDYNHLGVFSKDKFFWQVEPGKYQLVGSATYTDADGTPVIIDKVDGNLGHISSVKVVVDGETFNESVFPADNMFVNHWKEFVHEMAACDGDTPLLDAVGAKKDWTIDNVIVPYLEDLKKHPERPQLKIDIDWNLFKEN